MPIACPKCGSRHLRYARFRRFAERWRALLGIRPLRCKDCEHRFIGRTWRFWHWRFARCPRCLRMDLALWTEEHAHIGMITAMLLALGAKPYRCEYCRVNFVSFRLRHERFTFKRWSKNRKPAERA